MRAYPAFRNLHLYIGLFVSPFIVVFAVSVIFLVHSWLPGAKHSSTTRTIADISFPDTVEATRGRVFFTGGRDLDRFVVWDYVKQRRKIIG